MQDAKTRTARIGRLLGYLLDGVPPLAGEALERLLEEWLGASSRFQAFADAHADKIRKKLRTTADPAARGDVLAELQTAFALLAERRIDLKFEAYGSGRRGPDFRVTFRASHHFNLEVTRPRPPQTDADRATAIGRAVLAKLRQLPVDAPNALLLATGLAGSAEEVTAVMRETKLRADRREEEFFAGRGFSTTEFQLFYRRLGLLLVADSAGSGVHAWTNPEARRALPDGATAACVACLANFRWAQESSD